MFLQKRQYHRTVDSAFRLPVMHSAVGAYFDLPDIPRDPEYHF